MPAPIGFFRLLAADQAEWLLANGAPQRGALTALAALAGQARLWLVAPGEALTLHRLPLPSRKRSTWARAVPSWCTTSGTRAFHSSVTGKVKVMNGAGWSLPSICGPTVSSMLGQNGRQRSRNLIC